MQSTRFIWKARWAQFGGRLSKYWGRLTGNAAREFSGELAIMHGKLEEFYARRTVNSWLRLPDARAGQPRRVLNVVV
ncbi:MAG: hypothetical protein JWN94_4469 [Betaproteobacteria bacterium]|nr:hypothetical protein [Betaproteobacteria bacterium]